MIVVGAFVVVSLELVGEAGKLSISTFDFVRRETLDT